jgi:hypothetical protein
VNRASKAFLEIKASKVFRVLVVLGLKVFRVFRVLVGLGLKGFRV